MAKKGKKQKKAKEGQGREGRDLEKLVSRIKQILCGVDAKITSPDYIKGKISEYNREIDISIKYKAGDEEKLVIVECRDRTNKADSGVSWIEQIVTKKTDVGADKAIAVTSLVFSKPAVLTAKHYEIELRQMVGLTREVALMWLEGLNMSISFFRTDIEACSFVLADSQGKPERYDVLPDTEVPTLIDKSNGNSVELTEVWQRVFVNNEKLLDELKPNARPVVVRSKIPLAGKYQVLINGTLRDPLMVVMENKLWNESSDPQSIAAKQYSNEEKEVLAEVIDLEIKPSDQAFQITIKRQNNSDDIQSIVETDRSKGSHLYAEIKDRP
jgi:hypothetical protein